MDCPLALYLSALAGMLGKKVTIAAIYDDDGCSLIGSDIEDLEKI
jgi:hypothetical protein